jgi:hypothetical protein
MTSIIWRHEILVVLGSPDYIRKHPQNERSIKKHLVSLHIYIHIYIPRKKTYQSSWRWATRRFRSWSLLRCWWLSSPQLRRRAGAVSSWSRKLKLDAPELEPVRLACARPAATSILQGHALSGASSSTAAVTQYRSPMAPMSSRFFIDPFAFLLDAYGWAIGYFIPIVGWFVVREKHC